MSPYRYLTALLCICSLSYSQEVKHDEKLRHVLEKTEYKVSAEANGIFSLVIDIPSLKRSQRVMVNSEIFDFQGYRYREIWSIAFQGEALNKPDVYPFLLKDSADKYVGAWKVMRVSKQESAVFFACVPECVKDKDVIIALSVVAAVADQAEKKILSTDEY